MTYDTTGKRIRTENLAGQVTAVALDRCCKIDTPYRHGCQFDDDGNQTRVKTATGVWQVEYNGENRPIRWSNGATDILMSYDRMGRRVAKNNQRFVYNGYLQIAANRGNAYVWDPTEPVATRPLVWRHGGEMLFYAHDGNKNVSEVVASDGTLAAHYEYAPFGVLTSQMGALASVNPFRFSSEYVEEDTTTVYYNYRHYEPVAGRWLGRDPYFQEEQRNGYRMCLNHLTGCTDALGLWSSVIIETHQNMVREAIGKLETNPKCLRTLQARGIVAEMIADGNQGMDQGKYASVDAENLPLHYNRLHSPEQSPADAIVKFNDGLVERRNHLEKDIQSSASALSDDECRLMLLKLGELTHMLQDYYGHGVGWEYTVGSDDVLIGNLYGSPDAVHWVVGNEMNVLEEVLKPFVMKPSSYAGMAKQSEHGEVWGKEPGNRAPDASTRYRRSVEVTIEELDKYLTGWCDKCCRTLRRMLFEATSRDLEMRLGK